ncbi:insulin-degrading-like metalloprotease family [Nannochloropsis oceanica]
MMAEKPHLSSAEGSKEEIRRPTTITPSTSQSKKHTRRQPLIVNAAARRQVVVGAGSTLLFALGLLSDTNKGEKDGRSFVASAAEGAEVESGDVLTYPGKTVVFKGEVQQSPADTKKYRALTLGNGLKVLLVSDSAAERSAAALDVHVGHFSDPVDLPGLAHFCEHMLFLGTKKYPDEASYSQYLSAHGGSSNAYTDTEDTVYYFDVDAAFLEGGLDRFSEFFKSPLFTETATSRELNAIESENAKNLQNDGFRAYQLEKSRANPLHPFSKFGTGNLQTLLYGPQSKGQDVRAALFNFHEKYYIAPRMTLVVVGKEPLDTLQRWTEGRFKGVPTRPNVRYSDLEPWRYPPPSSPSSFPSSSPSSLPPPFLPSAFGKSLHVVPVQPLRKLSLTWVVPFENDASHRRALIDKPEYYVSHLLGHEGEGSLLSYLKREGLANALGAGYTSEMGDFALYEVAVDLTERGELELDKITEAVFSYLALLRAKTNGEGGTIGSPIPGPSLLNDGESWRVFHKLDRTFGKPRVYAIFQVANPAFGSNPRNVALTRLLKVAFQDALSEFSYPAALAGLSYEVDFTAKGLRLAVGGYHDKLPQYTREVAARLYNFYQQLSSPSSSPLSASFDRYKDIVTRELEAFDNLQPYQHAG